MSVGKGITDAMVLAELVPGEWVSGALIARKLGVSRNAISKHAANLRRAGHVIDAAGRKGMRLMTGPTVGDAPCPVCGSVKLFGPATIIDSHSNEHSYYDCARCHTLLLVVDGELVAKAGAW